MTNILFPFKILCWRLSGLNVGRQCWTPVCRGHQQRERRMLRSCRSWQHANEAVIVSLCDIIVPRCCQWQRAAVRWSTTVTDERICWYYRQIQCDKS